MTPLDPGYARHPLDVRIALLVQSRLMLMRYPLRERFGSDEHDRNMLAGACDGYIARYGRGEEIPLGQLWSLESDVAAFLAGGAVLRRRNKFARELKARDVWQGEFMALHLAAAYRPEGLP